MEDLLRHLGTKCEYKPPAIPTEAGQPVGAGVTAARADLPQNQDAMPGGVAMRHDCDPRR